MVPFLVIFGLILLFMFIFKIALKVAKVLIIIYLLFLLYANYDRILQFFQSL